MAALKDGKLMNLLGHDEPPAFRVENAESASPFLLTADHAGRLIPRVLGDLGVSQAELKRHIAWDIGIAGVTERLAKALGATAILQTYSRLVIDCNRQPNVASAFPKVSEATTITGNLALTDADRLARQQAIFDPYHAEIARLIAARAGRQTIYVAMHSFTPVYLGERRPMHAAVLYNRNPVFSRIMAALLRAEGDLVVAENEPYQVTDVTDYGVPVHAEQGGLDYLEIEIRQDLIEEEAGQAAWAGRLARLLPLAAEKLRGKTQ
jgi:predicted N-formylglutamate amidohydrolase